ncbi:MAG: ATP-binding cassette domain-containing protein [Oceanicaulis sp.]
MTAPALRLSDLRFAYARGGPDIVDLADFNIAPGERVFLKGASGSGKSTLLGLIAGILQARDGSVEVLGEDLAAMRASARDRFRAARLGVIFQMFNLLPYLPVGANVTLPCRFSARRGRTVAAAGGADAEARRLLARLGLDPKEVWTRRASALSVGQQQRVAAARALIGAPGLILANQGDTIQTYLDRIPEPSFMPDRDNVIPLFEEDWFEDDAYQRFREFLSLTFGEDRLVENLEFMRQALGKEVRAYLAKDFYADHVQRYKKRPIYWLVSSPKGAFQALIYMHRYTPDTLNITLNDYVRALRDKLEAAMRAAKALEINPDASAAEKNRAKRDIDRFTKQIAEVTEWERDLLYPLAVERIRIDLDDGVKANYPKFPGVLKPIKGLEAKDA